MFLLIGAAAVLVRVAALSSGSKTSQCREPRRSRRSYVLASTDQPSSAEIERGIREWVRDASVDEIKSSAVDVESLPLADPDELMDNLPEASFGEEVEGWGGEFHGINDPADAPWRVAAEQAIRRTTLDDGLVVEDIHWDCGTLQIAVALADGSGPDAEMVAGATRRLMAELESPVYASLDILTRHDLQVSSPGTKDVLTMQKEFEAFKGFDVDVSTRNPVGGPGRTLSGKLVEKNVVDVVINVKGRNVKIPFHLVDEVRLPKAKVE